MKRYRIGAATVTVGPSWVHTAYDDGSEVHAHPGRTPEDYARAASLGYPSVEAATRDHDTLHSLVSDALGLAHSPVLYAQATDNPIDPLYAEAEERLVLLIQRLLQVGLEGVLADYAGA